MQIHTFSYKQLKKQQRTYFKKELEQYLRIFWKWFRNNKNKIVLLKQFSNIKLNYIPDIVFVRNEFNKSNRKKWTNAQCYVCGKKPTIAHHIIQIQNGGLNIKLNIIRLCRNCHSEIHKERNISTKRPCAGVGLTTSTCKDS